ncbi:sensor histidine kinase [Prosthecobacter sp.]|jgi:signal transduction histidine kinase|uniref:sensor histidine kinase n=1 Tax=Prosthecobacter sp. TaxID=1965333 RepID=UPI0037C784E5
MRSRLVILLLALVVLPLGLVGWLGRLFWQRESADWQLRQKAQAMQELQVRQQSLSDVIHSMEVRSHDLLNSIGSDQTALRNASSKQPLIRAAFLVGKSGKLKSPDPLTPDQLSDDDREFLQRTASIWSRGSLLGAQRQDETNGQSSAKAAATHGWHTWYHQDGPHWLYWQRNTDESVTGIEIERMAFLSRLVGGLKAANVSGCVRLVSADGEIWLQQGSFHPESDVPALATLPSAVPMQHWHWQFFAAPDSTQGPDGWSYLLGFGGIGALFASVGLLLCFSYQRDLREASQRVSFVNQVSHELKTPLTNIRLYVDLARESAGVEGNSLLDVVEEETSRLSRMIHNVLTFARHEKRALDLHPTSGDLGAVVGRAVEIWRPLLARKNIAITIENTLNKPACFDADAVEQIFGNMLSNVEKYAASATHVEIKISAQNGRVELRVQDDGPGIPKQELPHVFDAFYRSRNDLTEGVSGTGLGLSIARALAVAQGGTLDVVEIERGACFVLSLPLLETTSNATPAA